MFAVFKTNKAFACQVIFNIDDWLSQQFLKSFFIRLKGNAAVYKEAKVWPYFVNVLHLMVLNHHLHTHLAPGRYTYNVADVPFFCMLYNLVQLLVPVFYFGNASAGFVKGLKPEWTVLCKNATKVTGIPTRFSFLQISSTAKHQESFCYRLT